MVKKAQLIIVDNRTGRVTNALDHKHSVTDFISQGIKDALNRRDKIIEQKSMIEEKPEKIIKEKKSLETYCEVCDKMIKTIGLKNHMKSQMHIKKEKGGYEPYCQKTYYKSKPEKFYKPNLTTWCKACSSDIVTQRINRHEKTHKHIRNLDRYNKNDEENVSDK